MKTLNVWVFLTVHLDVRILLETALTAKLTQEERQLGKALQFSATRWTSTAQHKNTLRILVVHR